MMFQEIVTFIAGQTGFVIGSTLQAGHRLATAPDRCVLIAESGGGATVPELPDRADFLIQALSRAKTYFEARDDAWTVYTELTKGWAAGWNMPILTGSGDDYIAWTVDALAIPQYIGQDVDGRFEFSVNFIFRMAQASCGAGPSGP
jgi:hypothetical protein